MGALLFLLAATLLGGLALVALIWHSQERIVFQPPGGPFDEPRSARRIAYTASDGQPLLGYLVGEVSPTRGLLIVFHGNADLAQWQITWAAEVSRQTGRAVLLPEYRGYASLPGRPTYDGTARDARAAYSVARDTLGVPASRIALFGHSLGSAIAAELARETSPEVLVLQSPFTSAGDMAGLITFRPVGLIWRWISRVHYDTEQIVRALPTPVWVVHGNEDRVIPARMGERVFAAARTRGELLIIDGAGHNDLAGHSPNEYWIWLARALRATPLVSVRY